MPKKRPKFDHIRFEPFGEEQRKALPMLLQVPGMKDTFNSIARNGHQAKGRGLIVWLTENGRVDGLRAPLFIAAAEWQRSPLLINTPHPDLLQALITYDPKTSYIVLIVGGASESSTGRYMWWVEQFTRKPTLGIG